MMLNERFANESRILKSLSQVKFFNIFTSGIGTLFWIFGLFIIFNFLFNLPYLIRMFENFSYLLFFGITFPFEIFIIFFIGYGFMERRWWVLHVSTISFLFLLTWYILRQSNILPKVYSFGDVFISIFGVLSIILFLNIKSLTNNSRSNKVIVFFSIIFLVAITLLSVMSLA